MLRFRVLLIDTEGKYERPVQAHFNDLQQANDWARKILMGATGPHAQVVFYRVEEAEIGHVDKSDVLSKYNDQITISDIQQAQGQAGKS